jgi:3'-phosphoadenosine 5'-phosphosulfate sulfotransferase (PAPS reductase)/FAD synthetase
VEWNRLQIWNYVRKHNVPYNELHERGYPTVGCTHCTVPVESGSPAEYSRAGRWRGMEKGECGLHSESRVKGQESRVPVSRGLRILDPRPETLDHGSKAEL